MPNNLLSTADEVIDRNGWGIQAPAVTAAGVAKLRKTTDPTSDQVINLKMR